ncbi:hypothetical protein F7Q99_32075 [Streptomyces kaniharaensis]|uniref:Isoamylase n=1 Tax=Streptomyces kaniharaensis TaxID=212423 RepID=A0A6N7L480_9ACTN|nr:isoamylase early set domain-containing protein [Streptomyces kaniharaensis]MQS16703.1 hypothetical protein [Streptomyces kaniharaensis]
MLERTRSKKMTEITFMLPAGHPAGETSVVGDFNNWEPGAHPLVARGDGARTVTIAMPPGEKVAFRYLAHDGWWFDEETADSHDGRNSVLHT